MNLINDAINSAARRIDLQARLGAHSQGGALEKLVALVEEYFAARDDHEYWEGAYHSLTTEERQDRYECTERLRKSESALRAVVAP